MIMRVSLDALDSNSCFSSTKTYFDHRVDMPESIVASSRRVLHSVKHRLSTMDLNAAFVIEAHGDEEQPEQVLFSLRILRVGVDCPAIVDWPFGKPHRRSIRPDNAQGKESASGKETASDFSGDERLSAEFE